MPNKWLNYQHLHYFMTIATEGGVTKAAAKLKLGQSTLSTQLKQFEDHLGIELFARRQKRLHLTEAGRIALKYAQDVFKLGDEMVDALHDRRQVHRISVQIGALDSIPKGVVVEMVTSAQRHQNCSVSVVEGRADDLLRALRAHEIDLAVFNHHPLAMEPSGMIARMIGRMPIAILGAKGFARCKREFPQSLDGQPFVMPGTQSRMRHDLEHFFKLNEIHADVVLEAQDSSLLTLLAAKGAGMIPVAAGVAGDLQRQYGLHRIGTLKDVHDELWLVRSERKIENPVAVSLFKTFAMEVG